MVEYVTKQFSDYVSEKVLKESILSKNPVPKNMQISLSLDDFVKELLEEQHNYHELSLDKVLKKLQHKTMNAMGPLSKVWKTLENAMNMK